MADRRVKESEHEERRAGPSDRAARVERDSPAAGPVAVQQTAGNAAAGALATLPRRLQRLASSGAMSVQRLAMVVQRAKVSGHRRTHILDGDATGGGHRYGSGGGKSEFPRSWSDDKIIKAIEAVSVDPAARAEPSYGGKTKIVGVYDGVSIRVIVSGDTVITGFPAKN